MNFIIDGQTITRADAEITVADSVGYLKCSFIFSCDWSGTKTAVFERSNARYTVVITDNACNVPHEVIKAPGFTVSAFCGNRVTSNTVQIPVEKSGYTDGTTPVDPTADVYTQIIGIMDSKADASDVYTKSEDDTKLAQKANKTDIYTKSETDSKLAEKADKATVYTKAETDNIILGKADTSNVYDKSAIDSKLTGKANSADVYTKSQVDTELNKKADSGAAYTKVEMDSKLAEKADSNNIYTQAQTDEKLAEKVAVIPNQGMVSITGGGMESGYDITAHYPNQDRVLSVYTKPYLDSVLGSKPNTTDVYTKSETDTALAQKANKTDIYTKSETDTALAEKANTTDTYTKTESDTALGNKVDKYSTYAGSYCLSLASGRTSGDAQKGQNHTLFSINFANGKSIDNIINKSDMDKLYSAKPYIASDSTTTAITYNFIDKNGSDSRYTAKPATIAFTFGSGEYGLDYISAMSFDTSTTAPQVSYTDTGILNWIGTDCILSDGKSIFTPVANKHYDIVFYYNGIQFIGTVNGFTPATMSNKAV